MDEPGTLKAPPSGQDGDGVRITRQPARGAGSALLFKAIAAVLVLAAVAYLVSVAMNGSSSKDDGAARPGQAGSDAPATPQDADPSRGARTTGDHQLSARPAQATNDPNDLANFYVPGQPVPKMADVIEELHKAGIHSGLGAFPPPGTSPPLIGLAVPDDYVLPEGYVRHFQATDDGQRIEPILMYSPDYEFFDRAGRRIEIPPDRVVPPELAPPGLPLRPIGIPPPLEPGSSPV